MTITAPAAVRKLAALVNGQQVLPSGLRNCWGTSGSGILPLTLKSLTLKSLTLKFRTAPGRLPLAVATDILLGCSSVSLTIGGEPQPGLRGISGSQILKIADLDWKIP